MSMGFMVAASSRKRDDRGRYAEENDNRRMEGNYGNYNRMEAPEMNYSRMNDGPEMRRRRDSRGRYMEDNSPPRMVYRPWPEPHIPPYLDNDYAQDRDMRPGRERHGNYEEPAIMNGRYPMRDRNIVNIRDYQDRRQIGFGARMHDDDADNDDDDDDDKEPQRGHASHRSNYPMMEKLTDEMATTWVEDLKNTDPDHPIGPKWSRETVKPIAMKHGFTTLEKQMEFWAVMNMMYSDYAETAKKHGVSTLDFYADMAKAWMKDKDAVEHKTAAYIMCCTK